MAKMALFPIFVILIATTCDIAIAFTIIIAVCERALKHQHRIPSPTKEISAIKLRAIIGSSLAIENVSVLNVNLGQWPSLTSCH